MNTIGTFWFELHNHNTSSVFYDIPNLFLRYCVKKTWRKTNYPLRYFMKVVFFFFREWFSSSESDEKMKLSRNCFVLFFNFLLIFILALLTHLVIQTVILDSSYCKSFPIRVGSYCPFKKSYCVILPS